MSRPVRKIVVVGGGAAGWLTAGTIAAEHDAGRETGVTVTLVESPDVATIGVGEGTWPTMRRTLRRLGISETEFIRQCDASFKQGTRFDGWCTGAERDRYYHPFSLPLGYATTSLIPSWQARRQQISFADALSSQSHICERGLAPKQSATPEYAAVVNYGYHLDAGKFSQMLQKHCTEILGVQHILDHVTGINATDNGDIASLDSKQHGEIEGDLFIDCTGFASLAADSPIESQTISTAQSAGWIWDIGLSSRRGVGYVYSSGHISNTKAEAELRAYIKPAMGKEADSVALRKISINPGHRQEFWHRNCVAVGMSAGFLEPLEASALVLVELSAEMLSEQLPVTRDTMDIVARFSNSTML
jgi:glycine/D-amino acid oxidase-like deaminating enzyme